MRIVIVDWSGLVSDDRKPIYEVNCRILKQNGIEPPSYKEWLFRTTGNPNDFFGRYGISVDLELRTRVYNEVIRDGIVPIIYPEVKDVFQYLTERRIKLAVVSFHPHNNLVEEAINYRIHDFLAKIKGSSEDKSIDLIETCREFHAVPEITLYIGDTVTDIRAAKKAGLLSAGKVGGYTTRDQLLAEKPDYIFETLSDLKWYF